jgi:hypothetical protein
MGGEDVMTMQEQPQGLSAAAIEVAMTCGFGPLPNDPAPEVDPMVFQLAKTRGSAAELARMLGVEEAEVLRRVSCGRLYALHDREQRKPVYPLYQGLPGIAGHPIETIMTLFHAAMNDPANGLHSDGVASFFRTPNDLLMWATPLEVLLGHRLYDDRIEPAAMRLFQRPPEVRLAAVIGCVKEEIWHWRN